MTGQELEQETTEVLQRLVRFNTVNPPGNEQPAMEFLAGYLADAGFETELLTPVEGRPNLVADLHGTGDGPTLCFLGHVDTVLADASEWTHDPWSGDVADGFLWGRGALDMKSQVAAEAVAGAALARSGWRPAHGHLKLVFVVDEETGGELGAQWLTANHPDRVRCDMLLNEGGGLGFDFEGRRHYGVCCGEKGVFRFTLTARGVAGHASLPRTGDNALVKLGPVLERLARAEPSFELTEPVEILLDRLGADPQDPAGALARIAGSEPALVIVAEPMMGVTLSPTMVHASDKVNVIPSRAELKVDCRVPPGLGEDAARRRIQQVLGAVGDELELEFTETVVGNQSPAATPLMDAIERWVVLAHPGTDTVPVLLPGFSDSRWFRDAFPDCAAYGFFPQRYMTLFDAAPLVHSADERIDVRDLGFASGFYADVARDLLGQ
ncbi:MAG TPA: M20/M25/M40 family metallo-hydrolase [Solirubrobacteraceae bacterium]|nr:M20/M25/M40 family metallo-hydrolase [Solirubrobacteraceae bacterium]